MDHIRKRLNKLGFEADISIDRDFTGRRTQVPYTVTVTTDKKKRERFLIELGSGVDAQILDARPERRALLLMVKDGNNGAGDGNPVKMLLGHDERQLFVAAVPSNATTVLGAMTALKPREILEAERRSGVKGKNLQKRKNKARLRQGDFFFLPVPDLRVAKETILRNEPINRGRGASHMVEFLHRRGGERIWVCRRHPNGLSPRRYRKLLDSNPEAKSWGWQPRVRNAEVYAKGRITHREHATIVLKVWHRILPNTESAFESFETMAFID